MDGAACARHHGPMPRLFLSLALVAAVASCSGAPQPLLIDLRNPFPAQPPGRHRGGQAARGGGHPRGRRPRGRAERARGAGNGSRLHEPRCHESLGAAAPAPGDPWHDRRRRGHLAADPTPDLAERSGGLGGGFGRAAGRDRRTSRHRPLGAEARAAPRRQTCGTGPRRGRHRRDADAPRPVLRVGKGRYRPSLGPLRQLHPRSLGFSDAIEPWSEWPGQPRLAIHGTDDPNDTGQAVSKGCVRVLNALLPRLTDLPLGTPVTITP